MSINKNWIVLLPVGLATLMLWQNPFNSILSHGKAPLDHLVSTQKTNIQIAAAKIDGSVLKPGETFSFNRIVGPRTYQRGFLSAPTYIGGATGNSEGGGICLLSSLVYRYALEANLAVVERHAHSRLIKSCEPGFDATVSYDQLDLKIKNDTKAPVLIECKATPTMLDLKFLGSVDAKNSAQKESGSIYGVKSISKDGISVSVYKDNGKSVSLINHDVYKR